MFGVIGLAVCQKCWFGCLSEVLFFGCLSEVLFLD